MKDKIKLDSIKNFIQLPDGYDPESVMERKQQAGEIGINEDEDMTFIATITNKDVDVDGDILVPSGCDLNLYLKNPVVLWSHSHSRPPIGKTVAVTVSENDIKAKIKLAPTEEGKEIWQLVKGRFIRGNSIGFFIKKAFVKGSQEFLDFITKTGMEVKDNCNRIITEFTLMENSLCSIPCNSDSLIQAISSKSISISEKIQKDLGLNKIETKEEVTVEVKIEPKEETKEVKDDKATVPISTDNKDIQVKSEVKSDTENKPEEVKIEETKVEEPIKFTLIREGPYKIDTKDEAVIKSIKTGKITTF